MICWYCHWGWPKASTDIYDEAFKKLEGLGFCGYDMLHFGPGHIVWSDENFESEHIESCIEDCDNPLWLSKYAPGHTPEAIAIVRESLVKLLAVPESVRNCEPKDYDEENPKNFPPPTGIEWSAEGR